jgi:cytochrome P450
MMDLDFTFHEGEDLPFSAIGRLRAAGPVVWSDSLAGWLVSGYPQVRAVLGDVSRFVMAGTAVAQVFTADGMLVNDTPFHHVIRAVWSGPAGRPAQMARGEVLEANARRALSGVGEALDAGEAVDLIGVIRGFVIAYIAASFGVPDDRTEIFHRWSRLSADTPALGLTPGSPEAERHETAKRDVQALVADLVAQRKAQFSAGERPDDFIALMVAAEGRDGFTPAVIADNVFNFMLGALDTTEKWLGNIVLRLLDEPAWQQRLRERPELIEPFAEEVMRCDSVAQVIQRKVAAGGAQLDGVAMARGDTVYVMLGAANRDAGEFANPDRFDPERPPRAHFAFGFGHHHCLGIHIARAEARAFVKVLLEDARPLRVASVRRGESWALWGPRELMVARTA